MKNIVDDTLVTLSSCYKQALPLVQEMINSFSTKVQFDELYKIMRNQNMKHIAAKDIHLTYGRSKGVVLFTEDKTSKRNIPHHRFAHVNISKK